MPVLQEILVAPNLRHFLLDEFIPIIAFIVIFAGSETNMVLLQLGVLPELCELLWVFKRIHLEGCVVEALVSEAEVGVSQVEVVLFVEFVCEVVKGLFNELIFC